jgi:hypothetical protein
MRLWLALLVVTCSEGKVLGARCSVLGSDTEPAGPVLSEPSTEHRAPSTLAVSEPAVPTAPCVRITSDRGGRELGLQAVDAPAGEIGAALGRATGCLVEVDEKLAARRLTMDLAPRPAEALFAILARRANARVAVLYRLEPALPGEPRRQGATIFASAPVSLEISRPVELAEALKPLSLRVEVSGELHGLVRISAARTPLSRVLDQLVGQVGGVWHAVVRLEMRRPVDAAAARDERERSHYYDLARLSSADRQEELTADVEALLQLPEEQRPDAMRQRASDIRAMARLAQETPGEHRGPVVMRVVAVASDYWAVLSRLGREQQVPAEPLFRAVVDVQQALAALR